MLASSCGAFEHDDEKLQEIDQMIREANEKAEILAFDEEEGEYYTDSFENSRELWDYLDEERPEDNFLVLP